MPRTPNVPCAGCNKPIWWNAQTSLPIGKAACRPCRQAAPRPYGPRPGPPRQSSRACAVCGTAFRPNDHRDRKQLTCSRKCGGAYRRDAANLVAKHPCAGCGTEVLGAWNSLCSPCRKTRARVRARNKRDRLGTRMPVRPSDLDYLAARDGWRCHLCRRTINPKRKWPDRMCVTVDHLIPVIEGGSDEPDNLRLAHLSCNSSRGAGGTVQLMLVG